MHARAEMSRDSRIEGSVIAEYRLVMNNGVQSSDLLRDINEDIIVIARLVHAYGGVLHIPSLVPLLVPLCTRI